MKKLLLIISLFIINIATASVSEQNRAKLYGQLCKKTHEEFLVKFSQANSQNLATEGINDITNYMEKEWGACKPLHVYAYPDLKLNICCGLDKKGELKICFNYRTVNITTLSKVKETTEIMEKTLNCMEIKNIQQKEKIRKNIYFWYEHCKEIYRNQLTELINKKKEVLEKEEVQKKVIKLREKKEEIESVSEKTNNFFINEPSIFDDNQDKSALYYN